MLPNYLATQLDKVYQDNPWYGPGLLESLNKIPEEGWQQKLGHRTVAGLVGHIIAWRNLVVNRLTDGEPYAIEMDSINDWPDCSALSKASLLQQLADSQSQLLDGLKKLSEAQLQEKVPVTYKFSKGELALGILHHDIYHTGQINLIVSLLAEKR